MKKAISILAATSLAAMLIPAADAEGTVNLALGKPVTAGSQYSQTGYLPAGATDGVIDGASTNRWAAADKGVYQYTINATPAAADNNQWLTVDLETITQVNQVRLYFQFLTNGQMTRISDFKIQYSEDGITFADVVTADGKTTFTAPSAALRDDPDAALADISFRTVSARYIRFLPVYAAAKNAAKNGVSLQEIEVYYDPSITEEQIPDVSGLTNLALTASASVSDQYSDTYSGAKIIDGKGAADGDATSRWASNETKPVDNTQKYLVLELSGIEAVNTVTLQHFTGDNHQPRIAAFKLEYSNDNNSWKTVQKNGADTVFNCAGYDNQDIQMITFDTVEAKYLKLTPTENLLCGGEGGNTYGVSIWEMGVYYNPKTDPAPVLQEKNFAAQTVDGASQTDTDGTKIQGWIAEYETSTDKTTTELGIKFESSQQENSWYVPVIDTQISGGATYKFGVLMSQIPADTDVTAQGYAYEE